MLLYLTLLQHWEHQSGISVVEHLYVLVGKQVLARNVCLQSHVSNLSWASYCRKTAGRLNLQMFIDESCAAAPASFAFGEHSVAQPAQAEHRLTLHGRINREKQHADMQHVIIMIRTHANWNQVLRRCYVKP